MTQRDERSTTEGQETAAGPGSEALARFEIARAGEAVHAGEMATFSLTVVNHGMEELGDAEGAAAFIGNIDLHRPDGSFFTNLVSGPLPLVVAPGESRTVDVEVFIRESAHGSFEARPGLFRPAENGGDPTPVPIDREGCAITIGPRRGVVADFTIEDAPERFWGFEVLPFRVRVTNHDLPELADPEKFATIYANFDLYHADGTFFLNLMSRPFQSPLAVGESMSLDIELYMRTFEGDYHLATSLYRKEGDDDFAPLVVHNSVLPARVESNITEMFVELTNACNFRCHFCPQGELTRESKILDMDLGRKILKDLADMGHHTPIRLHLLGEPLLYPHFEEFVNAAHDVGQTLKLATNGSRFSQENVEMLFRCGLDEMVISLNTPDEEQYNEIRGANVSFDKYIGGINGYIEELVRRGPPPVTSINILYDGSRADHPEELARVRRIVDEWLQLVGRISGEDLPPADEVIKLDVGDATTMQLCKGLELQWTAFHNWGEGPLPGEHFCHFPWRQLAILVDGQATACCVDAQGEIILGDATKQTVSEIWNGDPINRLREGFMNHRSVEERCSRCDIRHNKAEYFPTG